MVIDSLYVEDSLDDFRDYSPILQEAWATLGTGLEIRFEHAKDAHIARALMEGGRAFKLAVVDIRLGRDNTFGLDLIRRLKTLADPPCVVCLSVEGDYAREAHDAGADVFVAKGTLRKYPNKQKYLAEQLKEFLVDSGRVRVGAGAEVVFDKHDLRLASVVETLGRATLAEVCTVLLGKEYQELRPKYLTQGRSGSAVLRVEARSKGPGEERAEILLKFSRDKGTMHRELKRNEEVRRLFGHHFIPYETRDLVRSGQWYALHSRFAPDCMSFTDAVGEYGVETASVARALFQALDMGHQSKRAPKASLAHLTMLSGLSTGGRVGILVALDELGEMPDVTTSDLAMARGLVQDERVGCLLPGDFPFESVVCVCHGDLHGRNILVEKNLRSWVIDPGSLGDHHWATDYARLFVDVLIHNVGGRVERHQWKPLASWRRLASAVLRGEAPPKGSGVPGAVLAAIRDSAKVPAWRRYTAWEFSLAVATDALRWASYETVAMPKRVLALLVAADCLRSVEEELGAHRSKLP